jgi:TIR domain
MKHIFISHAGEDLQFAKRLESDLRNAGHETKVDTKELKFGDDVVEFINRGVAEAHTVMILYSRHTPSANWQNLEIRSALWNEIEQSGGVCVDVAGTRESLREFPLNVSK